MRFILRLHYFELFFVIIIIYACQNTKKETKLKEAKTDKTLVSWIILNSLEIDHGSVLTVQHDNEFDGIVFGEIEKGKWMAGSDYFNRSRHDQSNLPAETEESLGKLLQLAIVYTGNEIRLYRNAELYSKHKSQNIDLLSTDSNLVTFGLRHLGGEGSVAAAFEDARIYDYALSLEEIKALQPNKPSSRIPYAWWDFEGDSIYERTGRYDYHNLGEKEFELKDGKLILDEWGYVIAMKNPGIEIPEWPADPPQNYLTYHLAHPGPGNANPGDPNPAYFYNGRYHLHYIYQSITGFAYAHVSSEDMVHWKWHPTVLNPMFTGHGMFSGTGFFTGEGKAAMIYHGVGSGRNQLCYALDETMDKWSKPEAIYAYDRNREEPEIEYWDPDCWIMNDTYYALSGGGDPELMKSKDLKNWEYLGKMLHQDYPGNLGVGRDEDISCANMFIIGNKWMLLCISHDLGCRYFLGEFKDEKYLPEFHALMNWRNTDWENEHGELIYFAPESMLAKDGRRVMWAWLINGGEPTGIQSMPRELELPEDGILRIKPLRELALLRYDKIVKENIVITKGKPFEFRELTSNAIELEVTFSAPLPEEFGLNLLADEKAKDGVEIIAGKDMNNLKLASIKPPFELSENEDLTLRIFIDKNLVEVFANDRQAAAYRHNHIRKNPNVTIFTKDGDLRVKEIKAWKMKSIYEGKTLFSYE